MDDQNLILNYHMDNLNGLLNGSDSNSWPDKPLPEITDWFVYFKNTFTEEGINLEPDEGSGIVVDNGLTFGILDPDFKRIRVMQRQLHPEEPSDSIKVKVIFESELAFPDDDHLSAHQHDVQSYALLELVTEVFVGVQFGETLDELPLVDWELTRAVCEYLASEMTIHKSCDQECELKNLAERVFSAFADLQLPGDLQYRARNWYNGIYCPECSIPSFIRSIVQPPRSLGNLNLTEFPELPTFAKSDPVRYCMECGWES